MILDGEVLAWDGGRQETVPFGNNRTIARLRKAWMKFNNLLDPRDQDLHTNETNVKSMNPTNTWPDRNNSAPYELAGKECWLQFKYIAVNSSLQHFSKELLRVHKSQ